MIDLRRLRVLRAVAHYGTVTSAAERLHMTPSAASQQVRQLGRELGVVLLEPNGRRVQLTPAARCLLSHADAIEARWQQAEAEMTATGGSPTGELRLAGFPTALSALLAPAAETLERRHPGLVVRITQAEPAECFELLYTGDADLAVVESVPDGPASGDPRFEQLPLREDPFDLLVAADHAMGGRDGVDLADAAGERWIVGTTRCSSRQIVLAACSAAGFSPTVAHEAEDWNAVATLVAHHLGVALVPRVVPLPPGLPVSRVPVTGVTAPHRQLLAAIRRGRHDSPMIKAAMAVLGDTDQARRVASPRQDVMSRA